MSELVACIGYARMEELFQGLATHHPPSTIPAKPRGRLMLAGQTKPILVLRLLVSFSGATAAPGPVTWYRLAGYLCLRTGFQVC